eukprot:CAMPEP_0198319998 /NCGR_PEP_ID=MMETSP1450-20131203/9017_1 /TAXON_ID=753684 ORGANISM="Madagascaria erythrocladiodes, Strain CCMP3234" /NCGR_SAMPLE_ID=MMETSP1450 /ASSEMBLY_ACC=CAM_ASM_001115 /LENGTH=312 /DNA_ID=CAMNT_0044023429 /DNA_START=99 /DNA_END=1034 /DNA_ORIENTATION=+
MACCFAKRSDEAKRSAAIDKQLHEARRQLQDEIKILLLGPGDSGKSTLAKQIKLLYINGFSRDERMAFRAVIYSNVVLTLKELIKKASEFGYRLSSPNRRRARHLIECFFVFEDAAPLGVDLGDDLLAVWRDDGIQRAYARRAEFTILDSAAYLFGRLDAIKRDDYVPSDDDILRSRQRTRGISEITYTHQRTNFRLVDVGGQRNERNKWIHCFDGVTAIIYCAAISAYCQTLEEDPSVNRMHEALRLFAGIAQYPWFTDTAIILFLNKIDLFQDKIEHHDLRRCFADYAYDADGDVPLAEHAANFIKAKFE